MPENERIDLLDVDGGPHGPDPDLDAIAWCQEMGFVYDEEAGAWYDPEVGLDRSCEVSGVPDRL
jgi:hypothetical protein